MQKYLAILTSSNLGAEKQELPEHKLMKAKCIGGLRKMTVEVFQFFSTAKQISIKLIISP